MRKRFSLATLLVLYRRGSIMVSALVVAALAANLAALVLAQAAQPLDRRLVIAATACCAIAFVLLRIAYPLVRRALTRAEADKEDALASAHRDALTGTFTRSYFLESLARHVNYSSVTPVGYMQADMDHLKAMNDGNGHSAGDAALVHLISTVRSVAPEALIGRLGGDEFGIALVGHDNKAALRRLAQQILVRLGEPVSIAGRNARLSATIGVAATPEDASTVDDLISKADLALYKGKRSGRNLAVAFDQEMLGDERHKRFVERELRAAVLLNELELHYQPVFSADGVTLRSYEALVRWRHPVRGTMAPSDFIPVAEESDLIDKLGEWVLRRACLDLPRLGAPVAVNISAAQLRRQDFADRFAAIVAETSADGRRLVAEITETVPLEAGATELVNLDALRALGVRIAIDDFGAGHASLQYLRGFAFDIIKIDRTYVSNLSTNRLDAMIVAAICKIARTIGAETVAEGVETPEQLSALQAAGCTAVQGYLLGRPMPLGRLARTLDAA